ncbi:myotubularin-related protein 2 [Reticulomyxa filosa]|uniref:Myotubularin-related protein 2 n=1 Tax=Reticulomyxa filosa TaxID=46433 RepID=X6M9G5_RETFI|nr:myotubularin-related protein 2 [Reticulomyxa filosa]|eukprot:ETO10524.1 myotubularin-related protein 2 [Reticulomyxa filosa]
MEQKHRESIVLEKEDSEEEEEVEGEGEEASEEKFEGNILEKKYGYVFEDEYVNSESFHNDAKTAQMEARCMVWQNNKTEKGIEGTLIITSYLLKFEANESESESESSIGIGKKVILALGSIGKISFKEKPRVNKSNGNKSVSDSIYEIDIMTRRYRPLKFQISKSKYMDNLMEMLTMLVFPNDKANLFAFHYCKKHPIVTYQSDNELLLGWHTFDIEKEYKRMGIPKTTKTKICEYRRSNANATYEVCDTYPRVLVVPKGISDEQMKQVALFRRLGRIPALTWKDRQSNVALFRSSQPQVGMTSQRCAQDEEMLECIGNANKNGTVLYVMDARPKINAQLNKAKGAGFEDTTFYKNIVIEFLNVQNIHAIKKSRQTLAKIIFTPKYKDRDWWTQLANTEWLAHIRSLLKATLSIVKVIRLQRCSVLCHCSDGWDRTSQLCSLAQLCLDPYYRTIKGFIVLLEKDWLAFGHPFDWRVGFALDDTLTEREKSPIFEQFIDCVWQLTQQFPTQFQFTPNFLIALLDQLYSCRFGTFFGNCEKQRNDLQLSEYTISLWTFLQNCPQTSSFVNIFYNSQSLLHPLILFPKYHSKALLFWNNYYLRYCPEHLINPQPIFLTTNITEQTFIQLKKELDDINRENAALKRSLNVVETEMD